MKNTLLKIAGVLLLTASIANADPITGAINFSGGVKFDTTSASTATKVTGWYNATVQDVSGDFDTFVNSGDAVSLIAPWSFNSGAVSNFWSVGGFNFDLIASSIVYQGYGFIAVGGTGTASGNGFDPYVGTWSFTSQNPSGANGIFSFSGGTAVPDSGSTALLVGVGLICLGVAVRRQKAV